MKIVLTGAKGQLGSSLLKLNTGKAVWKLFPTDIDDLDITNKSQVNQFLQETRPDFLINCAAYTAVDKAESEKDKAFLLNEKGPQILAEECQQIDCFLVHVSTDYVFSGKTYRPYKTEDIADPQSVYGKSKLAGEKNIISSGVDHAIIRTSWLYSEYGNNFFKTMMRLGKEKNELRVVYDQVGSPTYAGDLAQAISDMIEIIAQNRKLFRGSRVYHYSNTGLTSWYDFAKMIMWHTGSACHIHPIPTEDYPVAAPRPFFSVMDTSGLIRDFGVKIPYWQDSLRACIECLQN